VDLVLVPVDVEHVQAVLPLVRDPKIKIFVRLYIVSKKIELDNNGEPLWLSGKVVKMRK
jgi:hypothetical protein